MNIKKAMVAVLPVLAALSLSACASTDLENTTYRLTRTDVSDDIDLDVSLTVTDLTDDEAADGSYSRTCMIQFSGDDCEEFLGYVKDYLVYGRASSISLSGDTSSSDIINQNLQYYLEYYDSAIDIETQFMNKYCKFYVYYSTDEDDYTTIYTRLDGTEDDLYFEILLDSDGTLNVYECSDNYTSYNVYVFCK